MAIIKCKMCGGDLEIAAGTTVGQCEYCGTKQTLPKANEEVLQNLFNRANALRLKCEFDKAEQIYEKILQQDDTEAEAHWGIVLCKYGIEYVEDPKTFQRIPTCHRTSYDAVTADSDYLAALEHADSMQRSVYEVEAKAIDQIQKNILTIVKDEKPFDVFLCYKETDENGKRTVDSTIANDIYHQLTQEGLKVFYAAITLEDKLGQEYEPYIFAALNSAKVMLVIGTKPQYFTAVWVKNEWSRFLKLMKSDRPKLLIPCYKDMDAYELPEEFAHLQAQDMGKIGFINDVVRGIKKITVKDEPRPAVVKETVVATAGNSNANALLKRGYMALEDSEWEKADGFFEEVLNQDAECAQAYVGKLMADLHTQKQDELKDCADPFDGNNNYQKALRFADEAFKATLTGYIEHINTRNENARMEGIFKRALRHVANAETFGSYEDYTMAADTFASIPGYKDAAEQAELYYQKAKDAEAEAKRRLKKQIKIGVIVAIGIVAAILLGNLINNITLKTRYNKANDLMTAEKYAEAVTLFEKLGEYEDSATLLVEAKALLAEKEENLAYAALLFGQLDDADAREKSLALWDQVAVRQTIAADSYNTVALKTDGTILTAGEDISLPANWTDIIAIEAGYGFVVGLKKDGTVVTTQKYSSTDDWEDIIAISAFNHNIAGLKKDGTVVTTSYAMEPDGWTDITTITIGGSHIVGLRADGTVVATGSNTYDQCDVSKWTDIVAISAGEYHTVGLKADGTVVAIGKNGSNQCDVDDWTDIVAISAGDEHTVGLKKDGTVVTVGNDNNGRCDVSSWTDIVAIATGERHTIGLKKDGTVVATVYQKSSSYDYGDKGQCEVTGWVNIKIPKK